MDNSEKLATLGTQYEDKQSKKHNTICAGNCYAQANTNTVNFTWALLEIKANRTSFLCGNRCGHHNMETFDRTKCWTSPCETIVHIHFLYQDLSFTMIFWTESSCWRKSLSSKATLILSWSHDCKQYTVVITNWLIGIEYPFVKWQWWIFFHFTYIFVLFSITNKDFIGLSYMSYIYIYILFRTTPLQRGRLQPG